MEKDTILEVIEIMSQYGLNVLHLHLGDDQGWRLRINEIEELTSVRGVLILFKPHTTTNNLTHSRVHVFCRKRRQTFSGKGKGAEL